MNTAKRGTPLTLCAILFGILAVSNLLKPVQLGGDHTGFVFLGQRLSGTTNLIVGPIFGLYLAAYAAGIWGLRRYALPMGVAYAAYVVVNLVLFGIRNPDAPSPFPGFVVLYAAVAIGVSAGAVWLLRQRREELR